MKRVRYILGIIIVYFVCSVSYGDSLQTLGIEYRTLFCYYRDTDIKSEYAVFRFQEPFEVETVRVLVSGKKGVRGKIVVYGEEGGSAYPKFQRKLYPDIKIEKSIDGQE